MDTNVDTNINTEFQTNVNFSINTAITIIITILIIIIIIINFSVHTDATVSNMLKETSVLSFMTWLQQHTRDHISSHLPTSPHSFYILLYCAALFCVVLCCTLYVHFTVHTTPELLYTISYCIMLTYTQNTYVYSTV
jgi:hypothetical protein